ncbi:MAG: GPR endopeptidase [Bacilli bacterium]
MAHEIDLSKYKVRTDLAIEAINKRNIKGVTSTEEMVDGIKITDVFVLEEGSKIIDKKVGRYITIEFDDVTDYHNGLKVQTVFVKQLKEMLKKINKKASCLVVGLGNIKSTPDALGPLTINNILVTKHLFMLGSVEEGFRCVSAINPGVMGQTGLETSEIIFSLVKQFNPDFIIVVDALASQSVERVNKTIQMTNTGIHPGSGIGNSRSEISFETLAIPVIAIGVPTVVDAITIVSDTINYMHKHYSYFKANINNPINKLLTSSPNYLKKDIKVNKEDKKTLLGIVGTLNDQEIKQLLFEVLTPIGFNLMVTPKEVDFLVDKLSTIIGNGINMALHENVNN